MGDSLKPDKFEDWARESLEATKAHVYPASLKRNQAPSGLYRTASGKVAVERVALGGYRLAALLSELFPD